MRLLQKFLAVALPVLLTTNLCATENNHKKLPSQYAKPGHTYWMDATGSIIDVFPCEEPDSGKPTLCLVGHAVDISHPDTRKEVAEKLEMKLKNVTDEHILRFCGFGPRFFNMHEENGVQKGNLKVAFDWPRGKGYIEGRTFDVEIEIQDKTLDMEGWYLVRAWPFRKKAHFTAVPLSEIPPPCTPPLIPQPQGTPLPPPFIVVSQPLELAVQ